MDRSHEKDSNQRSRRSGRHITTRRSPDKNRNRRSSKRCVPVTMKKVCGPSKSSCHYPRIYSRTNLIKRALKDDIVLDEFKPEKIPRLSTPQLCSFLGLASEESVKFNRVIEGKICGPDPEPSNPKVWTKNQLLTYTKNNHILSSSEARKLSRQDLCVVVADWSYKNRTKNSTFNLPETSLNIYPVFEYRGNPSHVLPFIYELLLQYPDVCFFMKPQKDGYYRGLVYNCDTENLHISSSLIPEMKGCNKRFFVTFIKLQETVDEHLGVHSNLLLYDKKRKEVWHYEGLRKGLYHECNTWKMFGILRDLFKREIDPKISFIDAPSYCPKLNLSRLIFKQKNKGFNTEDLASGLCIIMNLWILDNKFSHPDLSLKEVNEKVIKALAEHEYGMLNHILNWMHDRLERRKVLMRQAGKKNFEKYMGDLIYAKQVDRYSPGSLPK